MDIPDLDVYFLSQKFSVITFSDKFSAPFSLCSLSGTPVMLILVHFTVPCKSLKLSLLFLFFFSPDWMNSSTLSLKVDPFLPLSSSFLLIPSKEIFQFSYYKLQLCNFYLVLFHILYPFVEILALFMHCSFDLVENFYNYYFEPFI